MFVIAFASLMFLHKKKRPKFVNANRDTIVGIPISKLLRYMCSTNVFDTAKT